MDTNISTTEQVSNPVPPSVKSKIKPKKPFYKHILRFATITLGALIMALALEGFLLPNNMTDGGITGVAIVLNHITNIPLGAYLIILNLPFFYLGYKQLGRSFTIGMAYGVVVLSLFTTIFHDLTPFLDNEFLSVIYGGIMLGVGVGVTMKANATMDGSETLAIYLSKSLPFSTGEIIIGINAFVFTAVALTFNLENALASFAAYWLGMQALNVVQKGFDDMKSIQIVTDHHEEMASAIQDRLGRGVTYLLGEGAYSNQEKKILLVVFTKLEEAKMKEIINDIDPTAFRLITDVEAVKGKMFRKNNIH